MAIKQLHLQNCYIYRIVLFQLTHLKMITSDDGEPTAANLLVTSIPGRGIYSREDRFFHSFIVKYQGRHSHTVKGC